jgi:PKD repeat protein
MKTSSTLIASLLGLAIASGCTKSVEVPALAGPSTLAYSILLTASTDTLIQDGVSSATIEITARDSAGQAINGRPLRAAIIVDGLVQDFGSLSTKSPITGGTLRYTAPAPSSLPAGQVAQTITVAVTPTDQGDFRNEFARGVDIRLIPQGVILPTNPSLSPAFTVTPASPQAFSTVSFDAATTTNNGAACLSACSYAWNFGDGTAGTGITATHEYRTISTFQVTLTVTDVRGAQASTVRAVPVSASTPPVASFVMSPTPVGVGNDVFFNAEQSRATLPRRIVNYGWNFGDGRTASGVTVSRSFSSVGTYTVVLSVTDDAGAVAQASQTLSVVSGAPTAVLVATPTTAQRGTLVAFNASGSTSATSRIVSYKFNYGDQSFEETSAAPNQTHAYNVAGTYVATVTVTDALGRTAIAQVTVTINP